MIKLPYRLYSFLLAGIIFGFGITHAIAFTTFASKQPLSAEEAFGVSITSISTDATQIEVHWNALPGYYLYQNKFHLSVEPEHAIEFGAIQYSKEPELKEDPEFGAVPVFYNQGQFNSALKISSQQPITVHLDYQGCFENVLCYPPKRISIGVPNNSEINP